MFMVLSFASCKKCVVCHTEGNGGADVQEYCSSRASERDTFIADYKRIHFGYDTHGICDFK